MIDISLLNQLSAFAKYGTLSAAAEKLHTSQPALTRSMKKLESDLGVSLFIRSKNHLYWLLCSCAAVRSHSHY